MQKLFAGALVLALLPAAALAETAPASGEVRKIDAAAGKVTLKHGPIRNLDMDGMTMVFAVQDKALLNGLKPGDKVRFEADRVNGRITIIKLEKAK